MSSKSSFVYVEDIENLALSERFGCDCAGRNPVPRETIFNLIERT